MGRPFRHGHDGSFCVMRSVTTPREKPRLVGRSTRISASVVGEVLRDVEIAVRFGLLRDPQRPVECLA